MAKKTTEERDYRPHKALQEDTMTIAEWKEARGYDTKKRKYTND